MMLKIGVLQMGNMQQRISGTTWAFSGTSETPQSGHIVGIL
jgi:hypothetical protein